ncbi:MAG: hypothetical protein V4721_10540 [Bacteroidota bacterium]
MRDRNLVLKEFDFKSSRGFEMFNPNRIGRIELQRSYYRKKTQAERRFDKLIEKMQRYQAIRNRIIVVLLVLLTIPALIVAALLIASIFNFMPISIFCGGMAGLGICLSPFFWEEQFDCSIWAQTIKHKGKVYHYLDYQYYL